MIYGNDRSALRKIYFDSWHKYKEKLPLEPLEKRLSEIIAQHPQYHSIFDNPEKYLNYDFAINENETNPFLHLGMHTTILEQVGMNRPNGITDIYQQLMHKWGSSLEVEHQMINVLVDCLWHIQNTGEEFDEQSYLKNLQKLINA